MIKNIYNKPTVNIVFFGEKLNAFHLTSGTRQARPLSLLLFNTAWEVPANVTNKENERYVIEKEKIKLSLFAEDMIVYVGSP